MPTYEYECHACHRKFELFQGINERPVRKCQHCGKASAKRLIGAGAGIIFKGSGFYQTDYRSEEYKTQAKAESSTTTAATATETKTETKTEAKTETKSSPKKSKKD